MPLRAGFLHTPPHRTLATRTRNRIALLLHALGAAVLLGCSMVVSAQVEQSPLETQQLPVGEMFSLIIKADGESDPPARITARGLPSEAVFLRNLDGSRTFIWIPDEDDLGESSFFVTITDGKEASISATYPIYLEVVDKRATDAADDKTEQSNEADSTKPATPEAAPSAKNATVDETTSPDKPDGIIHKAEIVDQPAQPETESTPGQDNVAAEKQSAEASDAPPVYPSIGLSEQNLKVSVNTPVEVFVTHKSGDGSPSILQAMNLPQGAVLVESPGGHTLRWTPGAADIGLTAIILTARDAQNPSLATSSRLGVEVSR